MGKINLGIIGVGRFGVNYLRTLNDMGNANVLWICSKTQKTIDKVNESIGLEPSIKKTTNYKDILNDKEVDAVAIATPGSTHFSLAKEALLSNKHVIVEKPLAFSLSEAKELVDLSNNKKKILMASHIHIYNPAIQKIKNDIKAGLFGKINYIQYLHFGNGPIRKDMNALWDFFPHLASILLQLLGELPLSVSAYGASYLHKGIEDIVAMNLKFSNNTFVTGIGSWLYPLKKMQLVVMGEKLCAVFDDYAKNERLKYYNNVPRIVDGMAVIDDKGYNVQAIGHTKPLTGQLKHFLNCIENNKIPLSSGDEALNVVKVLECAQKSLEKEGAMVKVQQ